jgi:hypothetical protein
MQTLPTPKTSSPPLGLGITILKRLPAIVRSFYNGI